MAIQFTDFSRAPLLESPFGNMLENVLKGYQISQEPAKMAEQQKQRELANKLKGLELEHKPKEYELNDQGKALANALHSKALEHYEEKFALDRDYKKAQIEKALRAPNGTQAKFNGIVANYVASHPEATQEEIKEFADKALAAQLKHMETTTNRSADITAGNSFDKLPINDKKQAIALMKGMGVDPIEAASLLRKGVTPTQFAKENNISNNTTNKCKFWANLYQA